MCEKETSGMWLHVAELSLQGIGVTGDFLHDFSTLLDRDEVIPAYP